MNPSLEARQRPSMPLTVPAGPRATHALSQWTLGFRHFETDPLKSCATAGRELQLFRRSLPVEHGIGGACEARGALPRPSAPWTGAAEPPWMGLRRVAGGLRVSRARVPCSTAEKPWSPRIKWGRIPVLCCLRGIGIRPQLLLLACPGRRIPRSRPTYEVPAADALISVHDYRYQDLEFPQHRERRAGNHLAAAEDAEAGDQHHAEGNAYRP